MSALGRLVASIVLDTAEFTQGTDKASFAAAKTAAGIDRAFKDLEGSLKGTLGGIAGAFAAGFGIAALKSTFDTFVEGTAKLSDLSKQTGIAVEWLSGIAPVAKLAKIPIEDIATATEKMSKSLLSATNETRGAAKAFEFLGINTKDAAGKLKDSGTLMDEVAASLGKLENSNTKTAIAMDLFGKTGAKLLPFLSDMAEYGTRNATITANQAELARNYEKDLTRLGIAQSAIGKIISSEVLPVADAFVKQMLAMSTQAGGLRDQTKALAEDGSIRAFAMAGVRSFGLLLDAGDSVIRIFDVMGKAIALGVSLQVQAFGLIGAAAKDAGVFLKGIGEIAAGAALAMSGNWAQGNELIKQGWADLKGAGKDFTANVQGTFNAAAASTQAFQEDFKRIMGKRLYGEAFVAGTEEQMAKIDAALRASGKAAKDAANDYSATKKEINATKDAYDAMVESLTEGVAKLQVEVNYMRQWGIVTKETNVAQTEAKLAYQETNGVLAKHALLLGTTVEALKASALALASRKDQLTTSVDTEKQYITEVKRLNDAMQASVQSVVDRIEKEKESIATYGRSASAVTAYAIKQLEAKKAIAEVTEGGEANARALQLQINKMRELGGLQSSYEDLKQQTKLWEDVSTKAGNFFADLIVNGKSAFDSLKASLKSFAAEVIAFFAKKYILEMVAGGALGLGGTAANAATSALGSMGSSALGTGLSAVGGWLGFGGGAAGGGVAAGTTIGGLSMGTGAATGLAAAGESLMAGLAAIGPVGWIALAATAAFAIFSKSGGGPKTSGAGGSLVDSSGNVSDSQTSDARRFYNADNKSLDSAYQKMTDATAKSFAELLAKFGGKGSFDFLQSGDSDPSGKAMNRMATQVFGAGGTKIFEQKNENLARDGSQNAAEMQLQAQRALVAALQSSNLPGEMGKLFAGVTAATLTDTDYKALIARANDLTSALAQIGKIALPGLTLDIVRSLTAVGGSLSETTQRIGAQWQALSGVFVTQKDQLASAADAIAKAFAGIGMAVPQNEAAFRALIGTINLETEAGRKLFDVLSMTAPAFKAVGDAAQAAADQAKAAFQSATGSLNAAIGARDTSFARDTTLGSRNDVAQQFATATGNTFNEALLARMALRPETFSGLSAATMQLLTQFLGFQTSLERLDRALIPVATSASVITTAFSSGAQTIINSSNALMTAQNGLAGYLRGSLLNTSLSPLTAQQQYTESQSQYQRMLGLAQGGDVDAISGLGGARDTFLTNSRRVNASGPQYNTDYNGSFSQVNAVTGFQVSRPFTAADAAAQTAALIAQLQLQTAELKIQSGNSSQANILNAALISMLRAGIPVSDPTVQSLLGQLNTQVARGTGVLSGGGVGGGGLYGRGNGSGIGPTYVY